MLRDALIIGGFAAALLVSAFGTLLLYGSSIGLGVAHVGLRIAAFGGEQVSFSEPVCDKELIYAEVSDIVAEAVARPVTVVKR